MKPAAVVHLLEVLAHWEKHPPACMVGVDLVQRDMKLAVKGIYEIYTALSDEREDNARLKKTADSRAQLLLKAPTCDHCGKNPATCFGAYEGEVWELYACDDCCGHGNEDGYCKRLPPTEADRLRQQIAELVRQRDRQDEFERTRDRVRESRYDVVGGA